MSTSSHAKKVLFVSDVHIGAKVSNYPVYKKSLLEKMAASDHVVLDGDIFELFYVPGSKSDKKRDIIKHIIEGQVDQSVAWLESFLKEHPKVQVHFVLGNHENIRHFRKGLEKLQSEYKNFEWDPQGIRLGDALIVHGDLQMDNNENDQVRKISRLRHVYDESRWAEQMSQLDKPGQAVVDWLRDPSEAVPLMHQRLRENELDEKFTYRHEGESHRLDMGWVKHVFFGHTHVKFENYEYKGIRFHNTGAFTKAKSQHLEDLGVLEADLRDGKIEKVHPAKGFYLSPPDAEDMVGHDKKTAVSR